MTTTSDNAAYALVGKTIKGKWKVLERIESGEGGTGGFFSVSYKVSDGTTIAFMKAMNFVAFFQIFRGRPMMEILAEQTNAFNFERDLLLRCRSRNLTKVSTILDEGEEFVEGFTITNVPFLIFELADGDLRSRLNFDHFSETVWKLQSLHNVSVGLKQLHYVNIGHQDLKPSNVLMFDNNLTSKIGDLGRSLCSDIVAPHEEDGNFTGDFTYAPPEFLYRYIEPDWNRRIRATDFYLFGSLITFYFTGTNMTALIGKNMDRQFRWDAWGGTFTEVQDYLVDAFYKSIDDFKLNIQDSYVAGELASLLEICCFPYPDKRGYNRIGEKTFTQFGFERITSKLDLLIRILNQKNNGTRT